ncbi:uncharacterized protein LOC135215359 [Macrobrachium nipponense]|uniref:uncharacterized protein LOC135215359 n=1 Tax=Macrobrachium nipponense TaxID=159736 RepID=UPI0030C7C6E1
MAESREKRFASEKAMLPPSEAHSSKEDENLRVKGHAPKSHSEDQTEEPHLKKPCTNNTEPSSEHQSMNFTKMSDSEVVDLSRSSTEMFKDALSDIQSGLMPLFQDWIPQWEQLEEEEGSILSTLAHQGVSSQAISECLQQQLNDLHNSVAAIVSEYGC